jgi:hypothetical protein
MPTSRSLLIALCLAMLTAPSFAEPDRHLLYVAVPGISAELNRGGAGILVFDIDHDHQFVRRIRVPSLADVAHPQPVKGICASALTHKIYISTPVDLTCLDLTTDQVLWQRSYDSGCDRMSISPDGKTIYEPTIEKDYWHILNASTGDEITTINPHSGSHNTLFALDGKHCYLAGLKSPLLTVADASTNTAEKTVGPFDDVIRPFTINGVSTRCYVCINGLLGFEIGDLDTGKKLARVEVQNVAHGPTLRHGCPSHGIGLTPDEKELWLSDGHNSLMHIFDNTVMPPNPITSIPLRDQPGWSTFTLDGRYAYPSTGEVIDAKTHKILLALKDEIGQPVHSEKLLEIDFAGNKPIRNGDQFGIGRVTNKKN